MYQNIATKVLTGEVRTSYAHLDQPYAPPNSKDTPKYSVALLLPKSDYATKADIDASIEAAIQEAITKKWNGAKPPIIPLPVHDGDSTRQDGTQRGEECKGHWIISARSTNKPQIVHQSNIAVELLPQDIYSGQYARVTLNFFGYNFNGKKGIGCGLGNVMITRDGEPLSGGASAEKDFAGVAATQPAINPLTGQPYMS